ncbi:MBL fold metallo-hydrolase [Ningiella sp. W23]|uniref:MBL fold metallo-hydrolase n=1 Tax=Ningiella sp. W23 TaxID=3023715 RepID=UPI003756313B
MARCVRLVCRLTMAFATLASIGCSASSPEDIPSWYHPSKAHHSLNENGEIRFKNVHLQDKNKTFFDFMKMRFFGAAPWANHASLAHTVSTQTPNLQKILSPPDSPLVTWLGHSMFLIQYQGKTILTDPIFSERASPVSFAGPKRYIPHPLDYSLLPDIDIVVISHDHYDHLDEKAIRSLGNTAHYYVPLGLKSWFLSKNVLNENISEMDWWDTVIIDENITIEALPSQHWTARGLGDRFASLWASWAITFSDFTVWFAGDTGYNSKVFKPIGEHLGTVDLALIPIGAYAPRWFMQDYHVNPKEAVMIHQDLQAKRSIGMHWGTFPLTAEAPAEPAERLQEALSELGLTSAEFGVLAIGESAEIK